jgi:hypothetical protein
VNGCQRFKKRNDERIGRDVSAMASVDKPNGGTRWPVARLDVPMTKRRGIADAPRLPLLATHTLRQAITGKMYSRACVRLLPQPRMTLSACVL